MMLTDWLSVIVGAVGAGATVVIAFIAHRYTKLSSTQNALNTLKENIRDIDPILAAKFPPQMGAIPLADIKSEIRKDPKTRQEIIDFLNEYEAIAAGLTLGLFDEEFAKIHRQTALVDTHTRFQEFITDWRRTHPRRGLPAWQQLETLARRWGFLPNPSHAQLSMRGVGQKSPGSVPAFCPSAPEDAESGSSTSGSAPRPTAGP